jgi:hypothetical protein
MLRFAQHDKSAVFNKRLVLIIALRERVPRSYGQEVGLGFSSIVETNCGIQAEEVGIAGFAGVETFDTVFSSAGHNVSVPIEDQVNFFSRVVMVRKVCPARRELHQKQAGDNDAAIDPVSGALFASEKQTVLS